ncbi:hypothetical protein PoB_007315600 [Plakobranchus ocellatus]|uniref:Cadherin domain-containing protein n=1 Tax=Plakobranchus ocellatus TaxID=259542 RepID=A0AAV4DS39_9GAST|nr:hypothetical protein PoB_007315600 [Plakobranchus ocellatus]
MSGPHQLASNISQPEIVEVSLGGTAELGLEIYGYPTPHLLTLIRTRDNTNLTGSARHLIEYSPGQAPFGFVNVTISDVLEEDFTNYTITVDNGESHPLVYPFYLVEVNVTEKHEKQGRSEDDTVVTAVGVTVVALVILVIGVFLVVLVARYKSSQKLLVQPAQENRNVGIFPDLADGYEMPVTQSEGQGRRPEDHKEVDVYEEIDPRQVNKYELSDGLLQEDDETVQQPYANVMSPQQKINDAKENSYSNFSFDIDMEECVYVNTAGRITDKEK